MKKKNTQHTVYIFITKKKSCILKNYIYYNNTFTYYSCNKNQHTKHG